MGATVIEVGTAVFGLALLVGALWWYDTRGHDTWEALLSPDVRVAQEMLQKKFGLEEGVISWSHRQAACAEGAEIVRLAEAGARFVAGMADERVHVIRRIELYWRLVSAAVPTPALRLHALRAGFRSVVRPGGPEQLAIASDAFRALDAETLEAFRLLVSTVSRIGEQDP